MYEQLFLMYVIPSVMVQSYICYVTKPIVEVELSKLFSACVRVCVRVCVRACGGWGKGHKAKVTVLTVETQLEA